MFVFLVFLENAKLWINPGWNLIRNADDTTHISVFALVLYPVVGSFRKKDKLNRIFYFLRMDGYS